MLRDETDIVITSYFRSQFTWDCLSSLKKYTTTPHRVIVIDNGSDQETLDILWDAKEEKLIDVLILLDKNYGLEPAKNYALNFVRSERYIDSDNDILVPPPTDSDWLEKLHRLMDKNQEYAAIACPPQVFIGANKEVLFKDSPEVKEWDKCGGSMRLMRTDLVRQIGGWRSNPKDMTEANRSEEWYICGKLKELGYKVGYARDVEVFHPFGTDGEWGYGNLIPHYHRDIQPRPTDKQYGTAEDWYGRKNYE